jgi:Fur family ferric uptake transcriptional regulator
MKELQTFDSVVSVFKSYLKKNGLRKTFERLAILEQVSKTDGHFTAEQLFEAMQKDFRVSLASVYNNFELLQKAGLIVKHQFNSNSALYERTFNIQAHHHLVCTNCGKVKEFTDKNLKIYIGTKKFNNLYPSHFTLYIYGLCRRCYKASNTSKLTENDTDIDDENPN